MKSIIQQIAAQNKERESAQKEAVMAEIANPATSNNRRNFLKKTAFIIGIIFDITYLLIGRFG